MELSTPTIGTSRSYIYPCATILEKNPIKNLRPYSGDRVRWLFDYLVSRFISRFIILKSPLNVLRVGKTIHAFPHSRSSTISSFSFLRRAIDLIMIHT